MSECSYAPISSGCKEPLTFEWQEGVNTFSTPIHQYPSGWDFGFSSAWGEITGDFNGDGKTDYARLAGTYGHFFISNGDGTFLNLVHQYPSGWDFGFSSPWKTITGDFNGDGKTDYARLGGTYGHFFISNGDGTFSNPIHQYPSGWDFGFGPEWKVITGDFNGDGMTDYARLGGTYRHFFISNGDGTFSNPVHHYPAGWDFGFSSPWKTITGDFNGDGRTDYARLGGTYGHFFISNGDGTFATPVHQYPSGWDFGFGPEWKVITGDFNGDGMTDYARLGGTYGHFFISNGDGTFSNPVHHYPAGWDFGFGPEWKNITGDFNGDGKTDYARLGATYAHLFISNGDGTFAAPVDQYPGFNFGYGPEWKVITGDFTGDGKTDYARLGGTYAHLFIVNEQYPDQLTLITDGLGNQTTINYKPITDNTVYTKNTTPPPFPDVVNVQAPIYVVASHETDNGIGGSYKMSYTYGGMKAHRLGRGNLGYQWQETLDEVTGITTRTEYLQDPDYYEYIGRVETSVVKLSNGTIIREADYSYGNYPNGTLYSDAGMRVPYVSQSVERQYETNGSLISTVTNSTSGYDAYGNPRYTTVNTTDGTETFTRQTDSIMTNDIVNWRLGVVTSSKLTNTIPGEPAQSRESSFTYDSVSGLLKSETIEPNDLDLWVKVAYEYDIYGNRTKSTITGADLVGPRITTTTYDLVNSQFPYVITNAEGHSETRLYDERFGKIKSLIGPNGLETTWGFDAFGRTIAEYRADGVSTAVTYVSGSDLSCPATSSYALNHVKSVVSGTAPVVIYYDMLSREVQRCTIGFGGEIVYKDTEYNTQGKVWRVSRNYFEGSTPVWATYTYDVIGRVKTVAIDGVEGNTNYSYAGLTVSMTNPLSQTSSRTVNSIGELVLVTDALNNNVTYKYDPFGNLMKVTDAMGNKIIMGYDIRGHKTWMDDPNMGYWKYGYNVLGELLWQRDAKLQTTTMQYDKVGRMTERVDGDGTTTWVFDTALNGIGKLHTVARPEDVYSKIYGYDQYGREQSVTTTILAVNYTMSTSYTLDGKVDTITYPLGTGASPFSVKNLYDINGYLQKVQKADASVAYWTANAVNADGQVTWETLGNNIDTLRSFDGSTGLLSAISTGNMGNVQSLSYEFDDIGNLKQRIDDNQGYTENFFYDNLNRLTSAELVEFAATFTFQYDAVGNLKHKSDVGDYVYPINGANSIHPNAVITAGGNSYSYDENGNMISGSDKELAYTSYNKPYDIQEGNSYSTFGYAPDQGRIVQTSDEGITVYLKPVDNSNTLYEKTTSNNVETHKYYIYGGTGLVAVNKERDNSSPNETRYFHKDYLDSIDTITDESGTVVERFSYDSFGKRRATPCNGVDPACQLLSSVTNLGFTGHEYLNLNGGGLIHMNGRVYDPTLGRFVSADPSIPDYRNTQYLNRYTYVLNNPLRYVDPTGYSCEGFDGGAFISWYITASGQDQSNLSAYDFGSMGSGSSCTDTGAGAFVFDEGEYAGLVIDTDGNFYTPEGSFPNVAGTTLSFDGLGSAFGGWSSQPQFLIGHTSPGSIEPIYSTPDPAIVTFGAESSSQWAAALVGGIGALGKNFFKSLFTTHKPASLSAGDARDWYHRQLDDIPSQIDSKQSLRGQGLQAFELRNNAKIRARELMVDQSKAAGLPPPSTLQDVVRKAYNKGLRGDDVWKDVVKGSQKSDPAVDSALGRSR